MRRKSILTIILIVAVAAAGMLVYREAFAKTTPALRFVTIERGNLQQIVSSTGTLGAVTTVSVGTQVSGQVSELLVDFNDHVKKGELLARIDPTLAQQAVQDAQANLDKAEAQAVPTQRGHAGYWALAPRGIVSQTAGAETQSADAGAGGG